MPTESHKRGWIALVFMFKHGLSWKNAWSVAGTCLEMREFCRTHGIRRDGNWLVGRMDGDAD